MTVFFETSRLSIRSLTLDDAESLFAIFRLPEVTRWMGDGQPLSYDLCKKWIEISIRNYGTKGFGASALIEKSTGAFIGCGGIVYDAERGEPEVIYAFHPNAWGKGYASELVPALLEYGFKQCGLPYLLATIAAENRASAHVAEKAGMEFVREEHDPDGHITLVYKTDNSPKAIQPTMSVYDAVRILQMFEKNKIGVWVDGGWGVDALLGEQSRRHNDLDIAILHKDVPQLRSLLEAQGYRDIPRDDSWECNFVLGDAFGHEVDVHSCTFDEEGNNIFGVAYPYDSLTGSGDIGGHPVKCISPEWMIKFHTGYKLDENDFHDVNLLCQKFDIEIPSEYDEFIAKEKHRMAFNVETSTPPNTPTPIGPYNHISRVGSYITIGGTAGVDPATGQLAGEDVFSQAAQILESFKVMLDSVGSDLEHVIHINIFLKNMSDFEEMNRAYVIKMGEHRPARTVIGVNELPKPGVLLTMNLTAVTKE
ncbi:MAG TPA: GNAT family N-acetyltransferase [Anaerolineales bacterium]|nr:GNAT family N-acetyltransferase [Anaerolineales bacterium]